MRRQYALHPESATTVAPFTNLWRRPRPGKHLITRSVLQARLQLFDGRDKLRIGGIYLRIHLSHSDTV